MISSNKRGISKPTRKLLNLSHHGLELININNYKKDSPNYNINFTIPYTLFFLSNKHFHYLFVCIACNFSKNHLWIFRRLIDDVLPPITGRYVKLIVSFFLFHLIFIEPPCVSWMYLYQGQKFLGNLATISSWIMLLMFITAHDLPKCDL